MGRFQSKRLLGFRVITPIVMDGKMILGHRGIRGPLENTIPAFLEALRWADGVELDVRTLGDGTLVVHHDPGFKLNGGFVHLSELTRIDLKRLHPLRSLVPTLKEVMKNVRECMINVDVKEPEVFGEILNIVERYGKGDVVFSFDDIGWLKNARKICPGCHLGLSITGVKSAVRVPFSGGFYSLHVPLDMVRYIGRRGMMTLLSIAKRRGLKIFLWNYSMSEVELIPRFLDLLDVVISDNPKLLKRLLRNGGIQL